MIREGEGEVSQPQMETKCILRVFKIVLYQLLLNGNNFWVRLGFIRVWVCFLLGWISLCLDAIRTHSFMLAYNIIFILNNISLRYHIIFNIMVIKLVTSWHVRSCQKKTLIFSLVLGFELLTFVLCILCPDH